MTNLLMQQEMTSQKSNDIKLALAGRSPCLCDAPELLEIQLIQEGNVLATASADLSRASPNFDFAWICETDAKIGFGSRQPLQITGKIDLNGKTLEFNETFQLFNVAPWTHHLRDENRSFRDRLENYHNALRMLLEQDPDFDDEDFQINRCHILKHLSNFQRK